MLLYSTNATGCANYLCILTKRSDSKKHLLDKNYILHPSTVKLKYDKIIHPIQLNWSNMTRYNLQLRFPRTFPASDGLVDFPTWLMDSIWKLSCAVVKGNFLAIFLDKIWNMNIYKLKQYIIIYRHILIWVHQRLLQKISKKNEQILEITIPVFALTWQFQTLERSSFVAIFQF